MKLILNTPALLHHHNAKAGNVVEVEDADGEMYLKRGQAYVPQKAPRKRAPKKPSA